MSTFASIYNPQNYFSDKAYTFKPTQNTTDWFKAFGVTQPQSTPIGGLGEIPKTIEPGSTLDPNSYSGWIDQLSKAQTKQQVLQSALGLGTGALGGLLTMPFVGALRQKDFELGLQAMKEKEMSPSAVASRSASLQKQIADERSSQADFLRALSGARLAAGQAINWGK